MELVGGGSVIKIITLSWLLALLSEDCRIIVRLSGCFEFLPSILNKPPHKALVKFHILKQKYLKGYYQRIKKKKKGCNNNPLLPQTPCNTPIPYHH